MSWKLILSDKEKHFLYAIPIGFVLTVLCAIGCAFGMEYKDYAYGNKFDWMDLLCTVLGGIMGQIAQIAVIMAFL